MAGSVTMSVREYERSLANSIRFEFDRGVATPKRGEFQTLRRHVTTAGHIAAAIAGWAAPAAFWGQYPTVRLGDACYRIPDLGYWAPDRRVGDDIFESPTLAVELVTRDQNVPDLRTKCRFYRERGIPVVWLIDPQRETVEVFDGERNGESIPHDGVLESDHLPGFRLELAELWAAIR